MFKSFSGKRQPEYDYNLGYIKNEDYMPFFIPIDNENKLRFDKVRIYLEGNKIKDERLWRNEKDIITSVIDLTYVQDKLLKNPEDKHKSDLVNAICIGFGFNYQDGEFFDVKEYGNDLSIMPFDKFIGINSITVDEEFNSMSLGYSLSFFDLLRHGKDLTEHNRLVWVDINDKRFYAALSWESSYDIIYDNYTNYKKSIVR